MGDKMKRGLLLLSSLILRPCPVYYFLIKLAQLVEPKMLIYLDGSCVSFKCLSQKCVVICILLAQFHLYSKPANFVPSFKSFKRAQGVDLASKLLRCQFNQSSMGLA